MTCTTTDLDLGIWMLQRCAMDGNAWAQAVLDELQRLAQNQRPDERTAAVLDCEGTVYVQAGVNEVLR